MRKRLLTMLGTAVGVGIGVMASGLLVWIATKFIHRPSQEDLDRLRRWKANDQNRIKRDK